MKIWTKTYIFFKHIVRWCWLPRDNRGGIRFFMTNNNGERHKNNEALHSLSDLLPSFRALFIQCQIDNNSSPYYMYMCSRASIVLVLTGLLSVYGNIPTLVTIVVIEAIYKHFILNIQSTVSTSDYTKNIQLCIRTTQIHIINKYMPYLKIT
jgi:hypothetical protein